VALLLISNIGTLINCWATYKLYQVGESAWNLFNVLTLCVGESVQDLGFCVAHWIFAAQYYKIGTEIPFVVEGQQIPEK
jgi:hypothetical protein